MMTTEGALLPRDDRERTFLAEIAQSPHDEDARSVYADWLEERSEIAYAESLRIDARLSKVVNRSCAEVKTLAEALVRLRSETSATWRAVVLRWCTEEDYTATPLASALSIIRGSKHEHAAIVGEQIAEWVESLAADESDPYGIVRVYDKSVAIVGDFKTSANAVAVLGDLAIAQQYTDLVESDQSLLAVAGDIHCGAVWQLGELFVAGNLACEGIIYGSSFNANRCEVHGNVSARGVIENGHHFVIRGALDTQVHIGDAISVAGSYLASHGLERLDPAMLDDEGNLDEEKLYERICAGKDFLERR
jgi:uncharacterized protein (TIGR02996 family)